MAENWPPFVNNVMGRTEVLQSGTSDYLISKDSNPVLLWLSRSQANISIDSVLLWVLEIRLFDIKLISTTSMDLYFPRKFGISLQNLRL